MRKSAILVLISSLFVNTVLAQLQLESPDKKLKVVLMPGKDPEKLIQYRLILAGKSLIPSSGIGLKLESIMAQSFRFRYPLRSPLTNVARTSSSTII